MADEKNQTNAPEKKPQPTIEDRIYPIIKEYTKILDEDYMNEKIGKDVMKYESVFSNIINNYKSDKIALKDLNSILEDFARNYLGEEYSQVIDMHLPKDASMDDKDKFDQIKKVLGMYIGINPDQLEEIKKKIEGAQDTDKKTSKNKTFMLLDNLLHTSISRGSYTQTVMRRKLENGLRQIDDNVEGWTIAKSYFTHDDLFKKEYRITDEKKFYNIKTISDAIDAIRATYTHPKTSEANEILKASYGISSKYFDKAA